MAVRNARRALQDATSLVETIEAGKRKRADVLASLVAVGASLPDSAFVTSYSQGADGRGRLVVVAPHAAGVLAALGSSGVASPRLEGSALREEVAGSKRERVTVVFGSEASQ
jgi:hypothetical protein